MTQHEARGEGGLTMRAVEDVPVTLNVNVVPLSHIISGF